jgi:hypothetical protein
VAVAGDHDVAVVAVLGVEEVAGDGVAGFGVFFSPSGREGGKKVSDLERKKK